MNKLSLRKEHYALIIILIVSSVLNLANIGIEDFGNLYYASAIKSMIMNWSNFFFVAFDPSGFVSIDKPPLGFWIQALSAKIFGYNGWSILLPQAIAGVAGVGVLYAIVKRSFGISAGLISALILATTPVYVAVSRNNTVDNLLVLTILFACWALSVAVEKGNFKYLALSMILVGIGFNIKMLQAYMIVPAIYIVYLLSSTISLKKRIVHLIAGTLILVAASLSWTCIVDLVPSSSRPYVGGSTNNSVMELIVGHNGLERLGLTTSTSSKGGTNQGKPDSNIAINNSSTNNASAAAEATPPGAGYGEVPSGATGYGGPAKDGARPSVMPGGDGMRDGGGGNGGTFSGSEKSSITRLFSNNSLSDQIIWLLPLAILGLIAAGIKEKMNRKFDNRKKQALLLWAAWLIPEFIYFSYTTGLFHPYYLTMMAAPIAALAGIGIVSMWQLYNEEGWKFWLLPGALIINGAVQLLILSYNYSSAAFVKYIMVAVSIICFSSALGLIAFKFINNKDTSKIKKTLVSAALTGLLIAPVVWSGTTIFYKMSGTFPAAGLSIMTSSGMGGQGGGIISSGNNSNSKLVAYLKANRTTEKYLVAVPSAMSYATDIIINYGEQVMTLGGFSGTDNILTLSEFKQLVSDGEIRYAIINGSGGNSNSEIASWIQTNGKAVSESEWSNSTSSTTTDVQQTEGRANSAQLYDLKTSLK